MDDVARLAAEDRKDLFGETARRRGLTAPIAEKDFWVCWTLRRLFAGEGMPAGLLFKGGTSLSKVYRAIDRFSEDVDLSLDRADLGFGGPSDPLAASSGKKAKALIDGLAEACRRAIRESLAPRLALAFAEALGQPSGEAWALEPDALDPDGQTLLFRYPSAVSPGVGGRLPAYVQPVVRLELGARADHFPSERHEVTPYAAEEFPDLFARKGCEVKVLAAERTFWEKATILHAWHHAPEGKRFTDRQSRHYYDVVRLHEKGVATKALAQVELLEVVARHKKVFFAAAWARYDEAKPGTLRLTPKPERVAELREDYEKMSEMIFGERPAFEDLLARLGEIEATINALAR